MSNVHQQRSQAAEDRAVERTSVLDEIIDASTAAWSSLKERADAAYESGYLPNHVKSRAAARAIAMAGEELGIAPMTSYRVIYYFDGKIALAASLMQALAYKRVPGFKIDFLKTTEAGCWLMAWRPGMAEPAKICFTLENAVTADLGYWETSKDGLRRWTSKKDNWRKYPQAMCLARAVAAAVRAVAPEAVLGILSREEVDDGDGVPWSEIYPGEEAAKSEATPAVGAPAHAPTMNPPKGAEALKAELRSGKSKVKRDPAAPPPGFEAPAAEPPPPAIENPEWMKLAVGSRVEVNGEACTVVETSFGKALQPIDAGDPEPGSNG